MTREPPQPARLSASSPFNQLHRRFGIGIDDAEQGPRRGVGGAAVLSLRRHSIRASRMEPLSRLRPVAHGGDGDAQLGGELRLAEPGLDANGLNPRLRGGGLARGDAALGGVALGEGNGVGEAAGDAWTVSHL